MPRSNIAARIRSFIESAYSIAAITMRRNLAPCAEFTKRRIAKIANEDTATIAVFLNTFKASMY